LNFKADLLGQATAAASWATVKITSPAKQPDTVPVSLSSCRIKRPQQNDAQAVLKPALHHLFGQGFFVRHHKKK